MDRQIQYYSKYERISISINLFVLDIYQSIYHMFNKKPRFNPQ